MIRETPRNFLDILRSYVPDPSHPIGTRREEFAEFFTEFQSEARPSVEPVLVRGDLRGVWCTVPESQPDRTILFFHGGDFTVGSTEDHLGFCTELARAGQARLFSVDYRLAPEQVFPAQADDALAAYRYLISHGQQPHRIIPVGISAGATLVLDLLLMLRDNHLPMPPAAVCMSPVVDMKFSGESITANQDTDWMTPARLAALRTAYLGSRDPHDPLASPINAQLSGLPPVYLQTGTGELLYDDISAFAKKMKWAGVLVRFEIWEGMFHYWQIFGRQIPEAGGAVSHIGAFIGDIFDR